MAFRLSTFLPGTAKKKTSIPPRVRHPLLAWTRRAVPQTGGQNYSVDSLALPAYNLSGPVPTNAKRFDPLEGAPPNDRRSIPLGTPGSGGAFNGQVFSQPLLDPMAGGFSETLFPINAQPFSINGIRPAGAA